MGHHASTGGAQREILQLLRRALPGYHIQHNTPQEDALLHREFNYTLRWDIVPVRARLLSAIRFRREGVAVHLDPPLVNRVLFTVGRDHSADVADSAAARQIPTVHYGARDSFGRSDNRSAQC